MGFQSEQKVNSVNRPKILMTIGNLDAGGKERQLIALSKGLKNSNCFSTYIAVMNPNGLWESEASEYADRIIPIRRIFRFSLLSPLVHLIYSVKKEKVQLIHSWGSGIWDLLSLFAARICSIPYLHGGIRSSPPTLDLSDRLSRWSALKADAIVANSQAGLTAFGVKDHPRSRVIYNGIDFTRFEGLQDDISEDHNNLCMVANFSEKKDHCSLVSALPVIIDSFPDVSLTLVGHDAGTLEKVKSHALEIGVDKYIEFVTDSLNPEPYIAKSQIGLLTTNEATHGEGTANVLLEYMALSKPVVVSDNGGNNEVVNHGESGYLVPSGSPEEIAKYVIKLLNNKTLAEQMGQRGREILSRKFDLQKMVNSYISTYDELIKLDQESL